MEHIGPVSIEGSGDGINLGVASGEDVVLSRREAQRIAEVLDGRHSTMGAAARLAVETAHVWSVTLRPIDRLFDASIVPADLIGPGVSA